MAEQNFEEKTEKPTPKKREEVRQKGQVAKSRELPSVAVLLAGLVTLAAFARALLKKRAYMSQSEDELETSIERQARRLEASGRKQDEPGPPDA